MSNKITESEFEILQKLAKEKGVEFCSGWEKSNLETYPYIYYSRTNNNIVGFKSYQDFSFDDALILFSKINTKELREEKVDATEGILKFIEDGIEDKDLLTADLLNGIINKCQQLIKSDF